jgi:hypothetical protein
MRKLFFCLAVLSWATADAQRTIDVNSDINITNVFHSIGGEPVVTAKFSRLVEGTSFFKDDWITGDLILPGGQLVRGLPLKLDLYHREVHYKDDKDNQYLATSPIREVVLVKSLDTFRFVHSAYLPSAPKVKEGWYQQMFAGAATLYKYYKKDLSENKPFDSPIMEQRIRTTPVYYVAYNNSFTEVKKPKDVAAVLSSKKSELESWLSKEGKGLSAENQMEGMIAYFGELQAAKK